MKEDNGIITIEDEHGLKEKYKIVTCFNMDYDGNDYIVYSKNNIDDDNIIIHVSQLTYQDNNKIELNTIKSEATLRRIGVLLKQIIQNSVNEDDYELKSINITKKYIKKGYRDIKLEKKDYDTIRKDYNSNKKNREKIGEYEYLKEYTIEKIESKEKEFKNQFKITNRYINAIRNI